jgi:predicted metal-dependent hydrolase
MNNTSHSLHIGGQDIPIVIRRHSTSRRLVIRYQPLQKIISLTLPRYVPIRQGLDFVSSKYDWISGQIESHPQRVGFVDGQVVHVQGQAYTLTHQAGRGVTHVDGNALLVYGAPEFMARRVEVWLKEQARLLLVERSRARAAQLGVKVARISLRDNSSCWGSCTRDGNLSFSWRLIFATPEILDYVVCHEVAHLVELNHSQRFWALVDSICPHWQASRHWLKAHGKSLYSYGA